MSNPGEFKPAGIVHAGEFILPAPYDTPNWLQRVRGKVPRFVWVILYRRFRVYNPHKARAAETLLKAVGVADEN